jgi:molybdenum cofactor cytidylyltransferase
VELYQALRLGAGDVVAFVGAGGKTGCMRRIMQERSQEALVLATTTTNLAKQEAAIAPEHFVILSAEDLEQAFSTLDKNGGALFTGPLNTIEDKWTSLADDLVSRLIGQAKASGGMLLVEADGARRKYLKAPAEHEPVIPSQTTVVVPVICIDVLEQPLTDDVVHRPERVARLLGIERGSLLRANHLAKLIRHEGGGLKNVPEQAQVRVFINGVEAQENLDQAQTIARELDCERRISSVVLGALTSDDPVCEVWGKTGVVILAAGGSSRFGSPKLNEKWRGEFILRQVVEMVLASGCEPMVVVLGADYEQLSGSISDLPVPILENPQWSDGQSTSLIAGLQAIKNRCDAIIFVLGDMPAIDQAVLSALVDAHRVTLESVIAPYAGGRWGNPVLFDRRTFRDLATLEGDRGGRALFEKYPPYAISGHKGVLLDIDTPDDLKMDP